MPLPGTLLDDDVVHRIFDAYADEPSHRLSNAGFRRLVLEAPNLLTPWFGMVDVDLAYAQARGHSCRRLDATQFVEALVFLTWRKYPEEAQRDAFHRVLHESIYLLPAAPKSAHRMAADFAAARLAVSANHTWNSPVSPMAHVDNVKLDDLSSTQPTVDDFILPDNYRLAEPTLPQISPDIWLSSLSEYPPARLPSASAGGFFIAALYFTCKVYERRKIQHSFRKWIELAKSMKCRAESLGRIDHRWSLKLAKSAFDTWIQHTCRMKRAESQLVLPKLWAHQREQALRRHVWNQWHEYKQLAVKRRKVLQQIWMHYRAKDVRCCLKRWLAYTGHLRTCHFAMRLLLRRRRRQLSRQAFQRWWTLSATLSALNRVMRSAWRRIRGEVYIKVLLTRHRQLQHQRGLKLIEDMCARGQVSRAFVTWRHGLAVDLLTRSLASRQRRRLTAVALAAWRDSLAARRHNLKMLSRLVARHRRVQVQTAFTTWIKCSWAYHGEQIERWTTSTKHTACIFAFLGILKQRTKRLEAQSFTRWLEFTLCSRNEHAQRQQFILSRLIFRRAFNLHKVVAFRFQRWRTAAIHLAQESQRQTEEKASLMEKHQARALMLLKKWMKNCKVNALQLGFMKWMEKCRSIALQTKAASQMVSIFTKVEIRRSWHQLRRHCKSCQRLERLFQVLKRLGARLALAVWRRAVYHLNQQHLVQKQRTKSQELHLRILRHILLRSKLTLVRHAWVKWKAQSSLRRVHDAHEVSLHSSFRLWFRLYSRRVRLKVQCQAFQTLRRAALHSKLNEVKEIQLESLFTVSRRRVNERLLRRKLSEWKVYLNKVAFTRQQLYRLDQLWTRAAARNALQTWRHQTAVQRLAVFCCTTWMQMKLARCWLTWTQSTKANAQQRRQACQRLMHQVVGKCLRRGWKQWLCVIHAAGLWEMHWNRECSAYYYTNILTNQSQWELPRGMTIHPRSSILLDRIGKGVDLLQKIHDRRTRRKLVQHFCMWKAQTAIDIAQSILCIEYQAQCQARVQNVVEKMELELVGCYYACKALVSERNLVSKVFAQWKQATQADNLAIEIADRSFKQRLLDKRRKVLVFMEWRSAVWMNQAQEKSHAQQQTTRFTKGIMHLLHWRTCRRSRLLWRGYLAFQSYKQYIAALECQLLAVLSHNKTHAFFHRWASTASKNIELRRRYHRWQCRKKATVWHYWHIFSRRRQGHRDAIYSLNQIVVRQVLVRAIQRWRRRLDQVHRLRGLLTRRRIFETRWAWSHWRYKTRVHQIAKMKFARCMLSRGFDNLLRWLLQCFSRWRYIAQRRQRVRHHLQRLVSIEHRHCLQLFVHQWKRLVIFSRGGEKLMAKFRLAWMKSKWVTWKKQTKRVCAVSVTLDRLGRSVKGFFIRRGFSSWKDFLHHARQTQLFQMSLRKQALAARAYSRDRHKWKQLMLRYFVRVAWTKLRYQYVARAFQRWLRMTVGWGSLNRVVTMQVKSTDKQRLVRSWCHWMHFLKQRAGIAKYFTHKNLRRLSLSKAYGAWRVLCSASQLMRFQRIASCRKRHRMALLRNVLQVWRRQRLIVHLELAVQGKIFSCWKSTMLRRQNIVSRWICTRLELQATMAKAIAIKWSMWMAWRRWMCGRRERSRRVLAIAYRYCLLFWWKKWRSQAAKMKKQRPRTSIRRRSQTSASSATPAATLQARRLARRQRLVVSLVHKRVRLTMRLYLAQWKRNIDCVLNASLSTMLTTLTGKYKTCARQRLLASIFTRWRYITAATKAQRDWVLRQHLHHWRMVCSHLKAHRATLAAALSHVESSRCESRWLRHTIFLAWRRVIQQRLHEDFDGVSETDLTNLARKKSHYVAALMLHLVLLKRRIHVLMDTFCTWHEISIQRKRTWSLMPVKLASEMVQIKYRIYVTKRELCQIYDRLLELENA
ncbi:hypothetical protein AeRB84_002781 [Aphanomyces euteiches]|nr:hypothetical protein AeRB84_002781 [Aphanomyces euteiches]